MNNGSHSVTVIPDFERMELPSLHCWMLPQWEAVADVDAPTDRDEWINYQLDRMNSPRLTTFGAYLNGNLAGYIEAIESLMTHTLNGHLPTKLARVSVVFQRQMFGLANTVPALRMALSHIFRSGVEIALFPVLEKNHPIQDLYSAIGAAHTGAILDHEDPKLQTELFVLPALEWRKNNAAFIASYEPQEVAVGAEV